MRLNLGCCDRLLDGYTNVDRLPPAQVIADLERPWPFSDSGVSEVRAWDVFEHMPDKIHSMNESWRILEMGGLLDLCVPTTDGRGAFQDPTHRSFWTPNDLFYYQRGNPHHKRFHRHYGIRACFEVQSVRHEKYSDEVWKLRALLRAA